MRDSYSRKINYLKISLTEKCNLRCVYCKDEDNKNEENVIEDTMTGDIGAVAVPFVAPGESEDERNKKRKKRRKLATIMAVSTGSIDGTGN